MASDPSFGGRRYPSHCERGLAGGSLVSSGVPLATGLDSRGRFGEEGRLSTRIPRRRTRLAAKATTSVGADEDFARPPALVARFAGAVPSGARRVASRSKTRVVRPIRISSPGCSRFCETLSPLTSVPLRLPASTTRQPPPFIGSIRHCSRELRGSPIRTSHSSARPTRTADSARDTRLRRPDSTSVRTNFNPERSPRSEGAAPRASRGISRAARRPESDPVYGAIPSSPSGKAQSTTQKAYRGSARSADAGPPVARRLEEPYSLPVQGLYVPFPRAETAGRERPRRGRV